ncbi:MAG: O-antigen ligase family protein [Clostridium sp.]|nr:O-antigen ligase family protein [Clostridium sp.]MCM1399982.1 O-antigen ligase family protein [Clostridium sp.]MCM1460276.1 O-antigen ligase family protein [Bacteroides sp.]
MDNGKKKKHKYRYDTLWVSDIVKYMYMMFIFSAYLIVMNDQYFDITKTRHSIFIMGTVIFLLLYACVAFIEAYLNETIKNDFKNSLTKDKFLKHPAGWMLIFWFGHVIAFMLTYDKKSAFTGENGRYMGFFTFTVLAIMFFALCFRMKTNEWLYLLLLVVTLFAYVVAIFQHMGNDFMHYRDEISKKDFHIFMSTFGNINIFASFIVISLAVAFAMFVFTKRIVNRYFAGIVLVAGGMTIMIANSDSAYMGLVAVVVILLTFAIQNGRAFFMMLGMSLFALGNLCVVLINKYVVVKYDKRGGVAQLLDSVPLAAVLLAVAILIVLATYFAEKKIKETSRKRASHIFLAAFAVFAVIVIVVGIKMHLSIFEFNYKWGTYRGYIWTKCAKVYVDAPFINKLFGYGQETVRYLTTSNFYEEMLDVTGKVYENAHNELLQYLLTVGAYGLIAYIMLVVSSFIYILGGSNKNVISYISLAVIGGYFIQGIINLCQPVTTPLFFVILAAGVGNAGYCRRVECNE